MGQKRQESGEGDSIQESVVSSQEKGIGQKRQYSGDKFDSEATIVQGYLAVC